MSIHAIDIISILTRLALGGFFVLARFRFFYDPSKPDGARWFNDNRHDSLRNKMIHCGYKNWPYTTAWIAALAEVLGGVALLSGFLVYPAAAGLLILTLIATRCTWRQKVFEQNPVDAIDCVCCYLWRVEGLYILLAAIILAAGPGQLSLDYALFGWR